MRRRMERLVLLALAVAVTGCVSGPYWGKVELVDDPDGTDVVVVFSCNDEFGFHSGTTADREYRRVRSGGTFVFPWMWRGFIPGSCSLHAVHPLYRSPPAVYTERRCGDLGLLRLESWRAVLEGEAEIPMVEAGAWPHASELRFHYTRGFRLASSRRRAARFVPEVREIFHEVGARLPTRFGTGWARHTRRNLRDFERAVGYEPPALESQLFSAVSERGAGRVAELVAAGADPDAWDEEGYTPLLHAAENGDAEVARALLDAGADASRYQEGRGVTPLVVALERRKLDVARLLIERGADAGAPTSKGSPLRVALARHAPRDLIEQILAHGGLADPLEIAGALCLAAAEGPDDLLARLLDLGAPFETLAPQGLTPLMCAARWGTPERVRALLARGADAEVRDRNGRTALDLARAESRTENAAVLEALTPRPYRR